MKDRQKQMLRFLLNSEDNVRIDDIAAAFGIGSRTVSRDLDHIENWLSSRAISLERKTHCGIRVLNGGKTPDEIMEIINTPESYFSDLPSDHRQNFIFLYLIYNSHEVKISELATTFFVSDTCVWNDLLLLEPRFELNHLSFLRMKGVGVRIEGAEKDLRMTFLKVFAEVFTPKSIIPYVFSVKENQSPAQTQGQEINEMNLLLENLKLSGDHDFIFHLITLAEELLDFRFSASSESFIYFYLLLTGQRLRSGFEVEESNLSDCQKGYHHASRLVLEKLTDKFRNNPVPDGEIELLSLLLQISEWGDIKPDRWDSVESCVPEEVVTTVRKLISIMGKDRNEYYFLDTGLEKTLGGVLAALSLRMKNRIPHWYDEWNDSDGIRALTPDTEAMIRRLLASELGLNPERRDIRSFFFHFQASEVNPRQFLREKVRSLICCFEGIGLASYLSSVIGHDIPELEIVEATAIYKLDQGYLDRNRIDLVISTFPVPALDTPVVLVNLPVNRKELEETIGKAMLNIQKGEPRRVELPEILKDEKKKLSVNDVLAFIQCFTVGSLSDSPRPARMIRKIAETAVEGSRKIRELEKALSRRESLGALVLSEYGIRIFHCKSSAVTSARSGLLRLPDISAGIPSGAGAQDPDVNLVIYLIAPDPCPESIRRMLSTFTVALVERELLREILEQGDEEKVRLGLFDLYHSLL